MPLRAPPPHAFLKSDRLPLRYGPSAEFLFSTNLHTLPDPGRCLRRLSLTDWGMSFTFVMERACGRMKGGVTQKHGNPATERSHGCDDSGLRVWTAGQGARGKAGEDRSLSGLRRSAGGPRRADSAGTGVDSR